MNAISNVSSTSSNCSNDSSCSSSNSSSICSNKRTLNVLEPAINTANNNLYQFICLICVCLVCYYNSLHCELVFDDISAIRDNKDLRGSTPLLQLFSNDFWGTPMRKEQSHKSYRPLTVLTFRINYALHELAPLGYHFTNVWLHVCVCLLWRRVCMLLLQECAGAEFSRKQIKECSFLAALLFAVHPIHTEAVTGVVGRAELLSSICYLAAFLSYTKAVDSSVNQFGNRRKLKTNVTTNVTTRWWSLCVGFGSWLLASMLCKEQGITIAAICVAYEVFVVQQLRPIQLWHLLLQLFEEKRIRRVGKNSSGDSPMAKPTNADFNVCISSVLVKRLAFLVGITLTLLIGRVYVMGSQLPVFTRFDNPAAAAEPPARQLTYAYLIHLNAWLLIFPSQLCCDWTMGTIPLVESFMDTRNISTLLTFIVLISLIMRACYTQCKAESRVLLMCLAWTALPFLPASNLFFPVGFVVAERILYMPSMGYCLLIAYGYIKLQYILPTTWQRLVKICCCMLLLTYATKTYHRNEDWRTEYTLFMSGLRVNSQNAKLFNNVGHTLENEGRYEEALIYFQKAVSIQEDDIGAHINVGASVATREH